MENDFNILLIDHLSCIEAPRKVLPELLERRIYCRNMAPSFGSP